MGNVDPAVKPLVNRYVGIATDKTIGVVALAGRKNATVFIRPQAFTGGVTITAEQSFDRGQTFKTFATLPVLSGLTTSSVETGPHQLRTAPGATHLRFKSASGTYTAGTLELLVTVSAGDDDSAVGSVLCGQQAATTSAVALPNVPCRLVRVKNIALQGDFETAPEASMFVGPSAFATAAGFPLAPGEWVDIPVNNVNQVFIRCAASTVATAYIVLE